MEEGKYSELKRCDMAFQLKDGNILLISKEDINEIAVKIIVEASLRSDGVAIVVEKDRSLEKADRLYNILKSEKDMKPELRNRYLKQIADTLAGKDVAYFNIKGEEVDIRKKEEVKTIKINS